MTEGTGQMIALVDRLTSWPVGKGDKREARRLRGSVDQNDARVPSMEYRV